MIQEGGEEEGEGRRGGGESRENFGSAQARTSGSLLEAILASLEPLKPLGPFGGSNGCIWVPVGNFLCAIMPRFGSMTNISAQIQYWFRHI